MWAGALRVGEALNARRKDLILPADAAPGSQGILLRITMPKTRGRSISETSISKAISPRPRQLDIISVSRL